jgi:hypothetical protein
MKAITRRLRRLELRGREETLAVSTDGDARRFMEERLEAMSRSIQVERERGEFVEPDLSVEEVTAMIQAHLEESRIRREEDEKQIAARRPMGRYPVHRF